MIDPARSNADDLAEEARTEKLRAEVEAVVVAVGYRSFARQSVLAAADSMHDGPGPVVRELILQHAIGLIGAYAEQGLSGEYMRQVFLGARDGLREVGVM